MNNVVNLNRFRKQKNRTDAEKQADENRIKHGRTKAQKAKDNAIKDQHPMDRHSVAAMVSAWVLASDTGDSKPIGLTTNNAQGSCSMSPSIVLPINRPKG